VPPDYVDYSCRLTPDAVAVYKYAVENPEWTPDEMIGSMGFDEDRLNAALRALHATRLFRRSLEPSRRWDAVGPKCALVDLLAEEEAELRQAQSKLMSTQDELLSLVPGYLDALNKRSPNEVIDVFHGELSVSRVLAEQVGLDDDDEIWVVNAGHQSADVRWLEEFGVNLNNREPLITSDYTLADLLDLAEFAENRGFGSVWVGDSLFSKPRFEPISYWMRVGNDITTGIVDRQLARLKYGLKGLIPDGALMRVSTIGLSKDASYKLQDEFIHDLLAAIAPENRKFFTGA